MAVLEQDGNKEKLLGRGSFDAAGNLLTAEDELAMVTQAWQEATAFIADEQYKLEWRDCDVLYQSPRPYSTWEGTYVLEPNLRRFTVATDVNAIVTQAHKGLFYQNPPLAIVPGPTMTSAIAEAKMALLGGLLNEMKIEKEAELALEQWALLGTTVCKWGVRKETVDRPRRMTTAKKVDAGAGQTQVVYTDDEPQIKENLKTRTVPFFEFVNINEGDSTDTTVAWDPKYGLPDIADSPYVIYRRMVDFYDVQELAKDDEYDIPGAVVYTAQEAIDSGLAYDDESGEVVAGSVIELWFPPAESASVPPTPSAGQVANARPTIHHAEGQQETTSNPLRRKLEILEYLDQRKQHVICVLDQKQVIKSCDCRGKLGYLSANFWNRPSAMIGIGIGQIAGQNQRLDQGVTNAALKLLAMKLNTPYLRNQDSNTPTQMIRTGLGKVITVSDIDKSYKLLETPDVPDSLWPVLQDARRQAEDSTGADAMMVGGSSAGPRSSITRTSGGASIMAGASADRIEGPLGKFIRQVYVPFLYILDEMVFRFMPDQEIAERLGEALGKEFVERMDMQEYHDASCKFDVLAGAKLAAKRIMAQSLEIIMQYVGNAQVQELMADIHEEYFDVREIFRLILTASEWGQGVENSIIKKMTPQMKQKRAQASGENPKTAQALALQKEKAVDDSELEDQKTNNRIARDLVVKGALSTAGAETTGGLGE